MHQIDEKDVKPRWRDCRSVSLSIAPGLLRKQSSRYASLNFLREVIQNPCSVGAIAPTSRKLAESIVRAAGVSTASQIIELGPGAGAVTKQIMQSKTAAARVLAFERNPNFASVLDARFPDLYVIGDCVSRLREHAEAAGFEKVDCFVSALPWTTFSDEMQQNTIAAVVGLLAPAGVFTTLACLGLHLTSRGRRFRKLLDRTFREVHASPVVWRNLPPAFVYRCMR